MVYDSCEKMLNENLYTFSQLKTAVFEPLVNIKGDKLEVVETEDGFRISNAGDKVCLFVHGEADGVDGQFVIENNFSSIFPGEEKIFKLLSTANELKQLEKSKDIKIVWKHLNSIDE